MDLIPKESKFVGQFQKIILALQQIGSGQTGAAVLGKMLSIPPEAFHSK
jgi:hypothetical protein